MAVPLGGVIAGPLSGLIMDHMQGVHGLHGWQWLFILEGVPAVLLGIAAYLYLADGPQAATWLSADERRQVASDLARDRAATPGTTRSFAAALREPRVYLLSFIYFAFFCSLNTIMLWTPTLLKRVGVATTTEIGWLSGAFSVASAIGMVAIGYSSDRTRERRWHVVACGLVAAACFISLQAAQGSILLTGHVRLIIRGANPQGSAKPTLRPFQPSPDILIIPSTFAAPTISFRSGSDCRKTQSHDFSASQPIDFISPTFRENGRNELFRQFRKLSVCSIFSGNHEWETGLDFIWIPQHLGKRFATRREYEQIVV